MHEEPDLDGNDLYRRSSYKQGRLAVLEIVER